MITGTNLYKVREMDHLKEQLIAILVKKLGGRVMLPAMELDCLQEGEELVISLEPTNQRFTFEVRKKS